MAIQIRRGTNSGWESNKSNIVVGEPAVVTDEERAFIGTGSGSYMELANIKAIAPAFDSTKSYYAGDYVSYQGKLYVCLEDTSGAWNASKWLVSSIGQALSENMYANFESTTVSGDIVSVNNGAGDIPVRELIANIVAVQSGSGDPSPDNVRPIVGYDEVVVYVAGKNLLNPNTITVGKYINNTKAEVTSSNKAHSDVIKVKPSTSYCLNGYAEAGFYSMLGLDANQNVIGSWYGGASKTAPFVATTPSNCYYMILNFNANQVDTIAFYESATVDGYIPYNGTTYTTAVNVWDEQWEVGGITWAGGEPVTQSDRIRSKNFNPIIGDATYYCKGSTAIFFYDASKTFLNYIGKTNSTFDAPSNARFFKICNDPSYGTTYNHDMSINYPSNHTEYIPFKGADTTADYMDSFGKGVYGGTLNVTTGELVVTYGYVDLGTLTWTHRSEIAQGMFSASILNNKKSISAKASCSKYEYYGGVGGVADAHAKDKIVSLYSGGGYVYVYDTAYNNASTFKTAMNEVQLVYELDSPQTYHLSPMQVRTLLGVNNIWADSGSVQVNYRVSNIER